MTGGRSRKTSDRGRWCREEFSLATFKQRKEVVGEWRVKVIRNPTFALQCTETSHPLFVGGCRQSCDGLAVAGDDNVLAGGGEVVTVRLTPAGSPVANYAFDVTPARLVTGLITERGRCAATAEGLRTLFPEMV